MDKISTITVVIPGDLSTTYLETIADRIQKVIRGDAVPPNSDTKEYKTCDGIDISKWGICIGSSK